MLESILPLMHWQRRPRLFFQTEHLCRPNFQMPSVRCKYSIKVFTPLPKSNDFVYWSARAPTADLPNTAAFLGGLVAQEMIKMITKQYVPIESHCVVDLVETWTGIL